MREDVFTLFDSYAAAFARGERPDTREYLERAGPGRDELAELIDTYLARVTPPAPDEAAVALARGWLTAEPPLLELRRQRRLRVDEVVDHLIAALALDRKKRAKIKRYYQQLEGGLLEPERVDTRVWDVLAFALKARVRDLLAWRPQPVTLPLEAAFRVERDVAPPAPAGVMPSYPPPEPPDEIDRLFGRTDDARE